MITNIIEKSKNHNIVGALGYNLSQGPWKVTVWTLDELEIR